MTEKPEASVLTARRAAQHFRLSSADDAYEHLYILLVRSSLGPSPPNAGRYTVASRFRRRSCERGYIFPRAPEQFVTSPLCLVGYVRWDARSDRVPPLQTIIFSSFPGRTKGCRQHAQSLVLCLPQPRFRPARALASSEVGSLACWESGTAGNDWIDHCCFRRSRSTRVDYALAQESVVPTNWVQRSHLREEHSALLHLPLARSMESSRSRRRPGVS